MTATKEITVYLLCAPEDKAIREELEIQLRSLQRFYRFSWWHTSQVGAGQERGREIELHLRRADIVLLLISPYFLASDECFTIEMPLALKRREANDIQLIPILARPVSLSEESPLSKLQALPRDAKAISSLEKKDRELAYQEIAREIGKRIEALQPRSAIPADSIDTPSFLPTFPPLVQQRSKLVRQIYRELTQGISALMLTGIGGIGKSTLSKLVYSYASKQFEERKGPFQAEPVWLEIQSSFTMTDLVVRLLRALGKPPSYLENLLPQEQAELLFQTLDAGRPRLVILDQFEHFLDLPSQQARPELAGAVIWLDLLNKNCLRGSRVLLTSRLRPDITAYPHGHIEIFPVPDLEVAEGIAFLKASLRIKPSLRASRPQASEHDLQAVVERCKGHPLALGLFASLLHDDRGLNFSILLTDPRYWSTLDEKIADPLLDIAFQERLDQAQRQLLSAFSLFREPVPPEAAAHVIGLPIGTHASFKQLLANLNALRHRYLLQDAGVRSYRLHPLVASYVHDHFAGPGELEHHLALLKGHAKAADYYRQRAMRTCPPRQQRTSLLDFHDWIEAAWHWCRSECQQLAYSIMQEEGLFVDIQRCGGNAILFELYRMLLPSERWQPEPSQEARIYNEFGEILRTLGQKREAYQYLTNALSLFQEAQNLEGQVKTLNNLGIVYKDLGRLEVAFACYQQALHICETMDPPNIHDKAATLNNLGVISLDFRQKEQALQYFEQALLLQRTIEDRYEAASTLMNMGKVYTLLKRDRDASLKYSEALELFGLSGDRGRLASLHNHLGHFIRTRASREQSEKKREAWEHHVKALSIFREIGDRWEEAATLQLLGRFLFAQALGKEAIIRDDFYKQSLALYLYARQIFAELEFPDKGRIPEMEMDEMRTHLGGEQLATRLAEIESSARRIVEQVLRKGYALD